MNRFIKLICILQLACVATDTYAMKDVAINITPAWEGYIQQGSTSELGIQIISSQGGAYRLTIKGGILTTHHTGIIEVDRPIQLWIPVQPTSSHPLTIEFLQADKLEQQQQLNFISSPQGFAVTTLEIELTESREKHVTIVPAKLPRTVQGYGSIQTLALTPADLTILDDAQALALNSYLQACNELLLINANKNALNQLRSIAGCNGQAVHLYQHQPTDKFQQPSPSTRSLQALLKEQRRDSPITTLSLFFGGYLFILLLTPRTTNKPRLLLAIPTLSSIALVALWSLQENQTAIASWSEVESGSQQASFSALLIIEGINGDQQQLLLSRAFGLPTSSSNKTANLEFHPRQGNIEHLTVETQPFSHDQFLFQGSFSIPHKISLIIEKEKPIVTNHGNEETTSAILSWQGNTFFVPPLKPGTSWSPITADTIEISSILNSVIRAQSGNDDTALILPYSLRETGLISSHVTESGWLLIRPAT